MGVDVLCVSPGGRKGFGIGLSRDRTIEYGNGRCLAATIARIGWKVIRDYRPHMSHGWSTRSTDSRRLQRSVDPVTYLYI